MPVDRVDHFRRSDVVEVFLIAGVKGFDPLGAESHGENGVVGSLVGNAGILEAGHHFREERGLIGTAGHPASPSQETVFDLGPGQEGVQGAGLGCGALNRSIPQHSPHDVVVRRN